MASDSMAPLTTRSSADSPSYALRAALAERLAAHRARVRDAGAMLTQILPGRDAPRETSARLLPLPLRRIA